MTNGSGTATPALDSSVLAALVTILKAGTSPDVLAAQQELIRRLVLEGDVIPSRIPAPRNISEIGGYLNLLTDLQQPVMRSELIAAALGISPPPGLLGMPLGHPLAMVPVPDDRPPGPFQSAIPLTWLVRSDFYDAFAALLASLHLQGGTLPILSPPVPLPPASAGTQPLADWLPLLGREISVVPAVALNDPTSDPIVLASAATGGPYRLMARSVNPGTPPAAADWFAVKWVAGALQEVPLAATSLIDLAPLLANAGFYPSTPLPTPASPSDVAWSQLRNVTGLVVGVTTLQDELLLLFTADDLAGSGVSPFLHYLWDGTTFSPP